MTINIIIFFDKNCYDSVFDLQAINLNLLSAIERFRGIYLSLSFNSFLLTNQPNKPKSA